jgi:hypothetical protein
MYIANLINLATDISGDKSNRSQFRGDMAPVSECPSIVPVCDGLIGWEHLAGTAMSR